MARTTKQHPSKVLKQKTRKLNVFEIISKTVVLRGTDELDEYLTMLVDSNLIYQEGADIVKNFTKGVCVYPVEATFTVTSEWLKECCLN